MLLCTLHSALHYRCLRFHSQYCVCIKDVVLCYRTSGGFVALSPISPQELLLQPMTHRTDSSEDYDASQVLKLLPIEIVDRGK